MRNTLNTISKQMQKLLLSAQSRLQQADLWEADRPSLEALSSEQPFAIDTLRPEQWLQWIFIPRMNQLLNANLALPRGFEITPYFEQVCSDDVRWHPVLEVLRQIDEVCA
ncbi:YqcC family protein [Vibrio sp. B1Z05]|uniref:YqcC family protein n=2 Tax=Vibrio TaxID=662 RepID=UPI000405DA59|nr:YqcC family protein [Vibrio sp. B1Z05]